MGLKEPMNSKFTQWAIALKALFLSWLIRIWVKTLRYVHVGQEKTGPGLVAFWHGDQLPLLGALPPGPRVAPVSLSRDGRLQAAILAHLGVASVAGSSSRGGAQALRGLIRFLKPHLKDEQNPKGPLALFAVDGPRGPLHRVKPGVLYLAQKLALPVWPVVVATRGHRLTHPWDRYLLPRPFAKVVVLTGSPVYVARDDALDQACEALEWVMNDLERQAQMQLLERVGQK